MSSGFLLSINMIIHFLFLIILILHIVLTDFKILTYACISWINFTWSWCTFFFFFNKYCWTQFVGHFHFWKIFFLSIEFCVDNFFLSHFSMLFHSLLACRVSNKESTHFLIFVPLCIYLLNLASFKIFSHHRFFFFFSMFLLLSVHWVFGSVGLGFSSDLENFFNLYFVKYSIPPLPLLSGTPVTHKLGSWSCFTTLWCSIHLSVPGCWFFLEGGCLSCHSLKFTNLCFCWDGWLDS